MSGNICAICNKVITDKEIPVRVGDRDYHDCCFSKKDTDPNIKSIIGLNIIRDTMSKINGNK